MNINEFRDDSNPGKYAEGDGKGQTQGVRCIKREMQGDTYPGVTVIDFINIFTLYLHKSMIEIKKGGSWQANINTPLMQQLPRSFRS